jgi:hypothetical protein
MLSEHVSWFLLSLREKITRANLVDSAVHQAFNALMKEVFLSAANSKESKACFGTNSSFYIISFRRALRLEN